MVFIEFPRDSWASTLQNKALFNQNKGHLYEYRTKLGMTKVVLRGSWGCHCCKTDRGPP